MVQSSSDERVFFTILIFSAVTSQEPPANLPLTNFRLQTSDTSCSTRERERQPPAGRKTQIFTINRVQSIHQRLLRSQVPVPKTSARRTYVHISIEQLNTTSTLYYSYNPASLLWSLIAATYQRIVNATILPFFSKTSTEQLVLLIGLFAQPGFNGRGFVAPLVWSIRTWKLNVKIIT